MNHRPIFRESLGPLRCAISDRSLLGASEQERRSALLAQAARLAADGVDLIQLREKDLPPGQLAVLARDLLAVLRGSSTQLLINGRADVALATRAHGVHLTSAPGELTARQIHALYATAHLPAPIVTLSCHTLQEVVLHRVAPLTAILFGPVFEKSISGEQVVSGVGLDVLHEACAAASPIPVLALGGIATDNADSCLAAGAAGFAAIRSFQTR